MAIRWTRRPQNFCGACGYSWYPRGKLVSAECPRCHATAVWTLAGLIVGLILLPVKLIALVIRVGLEVVRDLFRLGLLIVYLPLKGLVRIAPPLGRLTAAIGMGSVAAGGTALRSSVRSLPAMKEAVARFAAGPASKCAEMARVAIHWVLSGWADVFGEGDREVNPVALLAKLLTFAAVSAGSLILLVNAILFAASAFRTGR